MNVSVRERCSCGAEIEVIAPRAIDVHRAWLKRHECPDAPEPEYSGIGTSAQVETAPQYTPPEMHIGFRPYYVDDE